MRILLYISAALTAYLVGGWNPAIAFSKAVYKRDIRECGSGNPGFTNFRRCFGNRWAWWVLVLDLTKAAAVSGIFARLFSLHLGAYHLGAAYTGLFAVLGHAYPMWYGFKGGKGFLAGLSVIWVVDAATGSAVTLIMICLLLITKYMSLSTVVALLCSPILLWVRGVPGSAVTVTMAIVLLVALRHKGNFKRLIAGTESKFALRSH